MANLIPPPVVPGFCGTTPECIVVQGTAATEEAFDALVAKDYMCLIGTLRGRRDSASYAMDPAIWDEDNKPSEESCIEEAIRRLGQPWYGETWFAYDHPDPSFAYAKYVTETEFTFDSLQNIIAVGECTNIIVPYITWNTQWQQWDVLINAAATISQYQGFEGWECPPNSHFENGTCIPDEGWEWCFEGSNELCPETPGIPSGPSLSPPELIPPITPGGNDCPDCYTYDDVSGMCIYTGGEGCDPVEPPCVETAGCDTADMITGRCDPFLDDC